jgi:hypothetical protein
MLTREAREELRRKMDETIMSLVAVARTEDDVSGELMGVAGLLSEARRRLEAMLQKPETGR